ncbi:MAG: hypothetical protein HY291_20635 [Planctomycetes bacterium]|nr:hypothetical protein [Planctomycetota bacterium]
MYGMSHRPALVRTALLGLSILLCGSAAARDNDKQPLFNTFYLPFEKGVYALTLRPERTFTLTDPAGESIDGTIVASSKELALISESGNRHFAFRFDLTENVIFEPTDKDTPNIRTLVGRMPPVGAGSEVTFVASQNFTMPPQVRAFHEEPRVVRPPRGHYEVRFEQVLVEPARVERRWVPAEHGYRENPWGHREYVLIRPGHYEDVSIPARYEMRETRVWVEDR